MALAFLEGQVISSGATPATTPAFTNAFAVGQIVVVYVGYDGGVTGLTTSVTDSKGNTYTHVPSFDVANGAGTLALDCWWTTVTAGHTGASPTVSVAFNDASTNANAVVQIFNGFTGTPTYDQKNTSDNASSTTATSGTTGTLAQAVSLVVGGAVHASTASAWTLGSGYTNLTSSDVGSRSAAMESKVTAATTAVAATFSIALARVNLGGVVIFYDGSSSDSINTNDTATITESITYYSDQVDTTEKVTVTIQAIPTISVNDTINTSDTTVIINPVYNVNKSDTIGTSDTTVIVDPDYSVNTSDTIGSSESITPVLNGPTLSIDVEPANLNYFIPSVKIVDQ